ncbi:MAG: ribonuclease HI family protein [Dehalococcoidales bacterium]|nr:MAG: ribonuclease HI family protein [Dehalococcoidales bacterium]
MIINTDGASQGNPGPAAIGVIIRDESNRQLASISRRIGRTTNNQAEYQAIIAALERAIKLGASRVELRSDSELVVKQVNGRYRVKNASLKPLYQKVNQLRNQLVDFRITHVNREQNKEADRLANKALK